MENSNEASVSSSNSQEDFAEKPSFLKRKFLKIPTWGWLIIFIVFAIAVSTSSEDNSSSNNDSSTATTERKTRFKESDDPIENLLHLAEKANPSLAGWQMIDDSFTDDDFIFDDIRLDVNKNIDYQSVSDASNLIDVALAIQNLAKSPIQIDIRIEVKHAEVQPDGSETEETIRREWIEVTGDEVSASVTVDVYGYLPRDQARLDLVKAELQAKYPSIIVKMTDTSSFD
jgi:hypothetical protein